MADTTQPKKLSQSRTARTVLVGSIGSVLTIIAVNTLPEQYAWIRSPEFISALAGLVLSASVYIATLKHQEYRNADKAASVANTNDTAE